MDKVMKNILGAWIVLIFLVGCITRPKCEEQRASEGPMNGVPPAPSTEKDKSEGAPSATATSVTKADVETLNRMLKAVDDYVFREKGDDFTILCKDIRFDCFVNDKRFPAGKKKLRRKVAAFVSGSKTGLQKDVRVNVRYNFYP